MNTATGDRFAIAALCMVGLVGMIALALTDHVEAAISLPPAVAAMAAILRNNTKIDNATSQLTDIGNNVSNLSNGELTDRIRAGFVAAMQETGHVIVDPEAVNHNDPTGKPFVPPEPHAPEIATSSQPNV